MQVHPEIVKNRGALLKDFYQVGNRQRKLESKLEELDYVISKEGPVPQGSYSKTITLETLYENIEIHCKSLTAEELEELQRSIENAWKYSTLNIEDILLIAREKVQVELESVEYLCRKFEIQLISSGFKLCSGFNNKRYLLRYNLKNQSDESGSDSINEYPKSLTHYLKIHYDEKERQEIFYRKNRRNSGITLQQAFTKRQRQTCNNTRTYF